MLDHGLDIISSDSIATYLTSNSINTARLNELRRLESILRDNSLSAEIKDKQELIFWFGHDNKSAFCKNRQINDLNYKVCLNWNTPFSRNDLYNNTGYIFSSINDGTSNIEAYGQAISIDAKYRKRWQCNTILILLTISFVWFLILSTRNKSLFPLLIPVILRIIMIAYAWSQGLSSLHLQDSYFNSFHYNGADLLLDTIILVGLILNLSQFIFTNHDNSTFKNLAAKSLFHVLLFLTLIRGLQIFLSSEKLNMSIENLRETNSHNLILIAASSLIFLVFFHLSQNLFKEISKSDLNTRQVLMIHLGSILFCILLTVLLKININPFFMVLFLGIYFLLLDLYADIYGHNLTWTIIWGIYLGITLSAIFYNYDVKKEINHRLTFLENIYHPYQLASIKKIEESGRIDKISCFIDDLYLSEESEKIYDKSDFETHINKSLDEEIVQLEIFDRSGRNIFNGSGKYTLSNIVSVNDSIFFDEILNILWFKRKVALNYTAIIGLDLGRNLEHTLYPFNYYIDDKPFKQSTELDADEYEKVKNSNSSLIYDKSHAYIIYKPTANKILVSRKSFLGLVKPIALFSLLFFLIVLWIIILLLINSLYNFLPESWPFFIKDLDSLNTRIQLALIVIIFLSFIIISSVTSSFLRNYIQQEKKLHIESKLENINLDFLDRSKISQSSKETLAILNNYKHKVEQIHKVILRIVSLEDRSKKSAFFPQFLYTNKDHPYPFTDYSNPNSILSYIPIKYKGKTTGFAEVELQDHSAMHSLNVFDFLGSIFNVYVFLFLIASVISIFIAQSITRPLLLLNQKLSQLKLGKRNETIEWGKNDEIGNLISNYNNMVVQLEQSAAILAKTERDSAWREMAKQVAHEIKNPLTPMKLSIQYLERAIKNDPDNAHSIAKKISNTILEQIENLTGIANAFGNFAELPKTSNGRLELNNIVAVVHNLFRKRDDMDINLSVPIDPVVVFADKNQLIRVLNNLVKNATEAIPAERKGVISIKLYTTEEKAIIEIKDNGSGIAADMEAKIFQPKFTTKDSGSGLGLAISSNIIESMNGRLYFETTHNVSTSFFVELDLLRRNFKDSQKDRIYLD